jgi:hypothetical protein
MNKSSIVKLVLSVVYVGIALTYFMKYLDFSSSVDTNKPLSYVYVDKRIKKGGRGESYEMDYSYKNQTETISITSKEYDLISAQQYPDLYYSKAGVVFSAWEIKKSLRITVLFFGLFVVTITPWNFLLKRMGIIKSAKDVKMNGRENKKGFL